MDFNSVTNWFRGITSGKNFTLTVRNHYFPEIWYIVENFFSSTSDKTVLDIGCGSGLISDALGKSNWDVTCIDPVLECLLNTQKRFSNSKSEGRFEQADPESLPFAIAHTKISCV